MKTGNWFALAGLLLPLLRNTNMIINNPLIKNKPSKENMDDLLAYAIQKNYAIALYQLPHSQEKNLIIDFSGSPILVNTELSNLGEGFVLSKFDNKGSSYFLKSDVHIAFKKSLVHFRSKNVDSFLDQFEQQKQKLVKNKHWYTNKKEAQKLAVNYQGLVEKSIDEIKAGKFIKVVPSRCKSVDLPVDFDLIATFDMLCQQYANAFVSLVSIPEIGTWMGASPEILIKTENEQRFYTAAVAGTQAYKKNVPMWEVMWRQKEIEEQALVSRYIIDCFKKIRLREFDEDGPKTAQAGKMVHLRTDFSVDMEATNFPQLGNVMLDLLHPTSAICGMPRQSAYEFLRKHEGYDREFYSGFLGPVNIHNATNIFVNIRCMQLWRHRAMVYAGAGVTRYSNPEQEWQETEMKCNTMMDALIKHS
jgi:isochorismate synthase